MSRPLTRLRYAALSDVVLAVRASDGDSRAMASLVERHAPRVRRLAHYLLDDPQDAEDAAQEALAKVLTRIQQFRGESRFATWLHSLVANTCRDLSASGSGGAATSRSRWWPSWPAARARTIWPFSASSAPSWPSSWAACPAMQRHVMVMKDVLALSYEEIAERLNMPVGTVKCHAHRGRARMRRALEPPPPPPEAVSA